MLFLLWVGESVCEGGQEVLDEEVGDEGLRLALVRVCEVRVGSGPFLVKESLRREMQTGDVQVHQQ